MSNNPQVVEVKKKKFPQPHNKEWTIEEVDAALNGQPGSNGTGPNGTGPTVASPALSLVAKRPVSGRYKGRSGEFTLELRVDVDGKRPTVRLSGDLFEGDLLRYWGSFVVPELRINAKQPERVTVSGEAVFSSKNSKAPQVSVTIPRAPAGTEDEDVLPATVTFSNAAGAVESFECKLISSRFRTVACEVDKVEGTEVFVGPYDTSSLDSAEPKRELSVNEAYKEAGIEMLEGGVSDIMPLGEAAEFMRRDKKGVDNKWSNAELHDSMEKHFSLFDSAAENDPKRDGQWNLWLLVATDHEQNMRGMMFDSAGGRQRQGCAVFYNAIRGDTLQDKRAALRTYVHEIGHCFNLVHSWEKSLAKPKLPDRKDALSFMNYVENYSEGIEAYWKKFAFEFDDPELRHLRHAPRDQIIMGGKFFGTGAAEFDEGAFNRPLEREPGLSLRLEARKSFMLCEPVVVELKLEWNGEGQKQVLKNIHPDRGFVQLTIRKPEGRVVCYRPFAAQCVNPEFETLDVKKPSIYTNAYIGYGRDGFYFGSAGFYQIVAVYYSPCGSEVVSEPLTIRVRNPLNEVEEDIADLYYGNDQGALFYLLGSDSEYLASGKRSLDNLLDKYGRHPLSVHARLIKGINEGRRFKSIAGRRVDGKKTLTARRLHAEESRDILSDVLVGSIKGAGFFRKIFGTAGAARLDNITLNMCARRLARAQRRSDDDKGARATLDATVKYFSRRISKPHVIDFIKQQADRTLNETY